MIEEHIRKWMGPKTKWGIEMNRKENSREAKPRGSQTQGKPRGCAAGRVLPMAVHVFSPCCTVMAVVAVLSTPCCSGNNSSDNGSSGYISVVSDRLLHPREYSRRSSPRKSIFQQSIHCVALLQQNSCRVPSLLSRWDDDGGRGVERGSSCLHLRWYRGATRIAFLPADGNEGRLIAMAPITTSGRGIREPAELLRTTSRKARIGKKAGSPSQPLTGIMKDDYKRLYGDLYIYHTYLREHSSSRLLCCARVPQWNGKRAANSSFSLSSKFIL